MKEGDRVRVSALTNWGNAAATTFSGEIGTVESVHPNDVDGNPWERGPMVLVRFDVPIPAWTPYGTPHVEYFFSAEDLAPL